MVVLYCKRHYSEAHYNEVELYCSVQESIFTENFNCRKKFFLLWVLQRMPVTVNIVYDVYHILCI